MFKSFIVKTDVTSLCIFNDWLLAGIGGFLNIFHINDCKLIQKVEIFTGQKIHGIIPCSISRDIILYGDCNIIRLDINS
ncbi:hypothetical protein GWI33_008648 [Rhynchophorus ferrugineus]|uniref:Uncharacterized protein n=1 Tax=Rhynchophorus ferrugineus TaxID=354439 RepID=A0A834IGJ3_RHYFE|nr:hypothetical protein GWI33_008648 [Rhynchophorus ferrugineus]